MNVSRNAPTTTAVLSGADVTLPILYAEGHTCDAGEAAALQFLFAKNVQNPVRKLVTAKKLNGKSVQEALDAQIATYSFKSYLGERRHGGKRKSPEDKVYDEILNAAVGAALTAKGISSPSKEQREKAREAIAKVKGEEYRAKAVTEAARRAKVAEADLKSLGDIL